jgi:hypothetical protein
MKAAGLADQQEGIRFPGDDGGYDGEPTRVVATRVLRQLAAEHVSMA